MGPPPQVARLAEPPMLVVYLKYKLKKKKKSMTIREILKLKKKLKN